MKTELIIAENDSDLAEAMALVGGDRRAAV
jgi:hypothetical protein